MPSLDDAEATRTQRVASASKSDESVEPTADAARDLSALRSERTAQADAWLRELLGSADGVALVAVGGYGRGELGPGSDLDVMMLHDGRSDVVQIADQVWYPIWDAGWQLDHSVRTVADAVSVANSDMKAALGMLHARHIAGVPDLTARLREHAFGQWRSRASKRLPELHDMVRERAERLGEVAFLLEPDLKEARGGLRDVHALEAIAAAWVAAGPGPPVRAAYRRLIDVRDTLQEVAGRPTTRMVAQEQEAIAARLGMADADELLRAISEAARTVSYASDVTWRSVEGSLRRRPKAERKPVAEGVVEQDGEVVLARGVDPTPDPTLVVRAAAAAAQVGLPLVASDDRPARQQVPADAGPVAVDRARCVRRVTWRRPAGAGGVRSARSGWPHGATDPGVGERPLPQAAQPVASLHRRSPSRRNRNRSCRADASGCAT